MKSILGKLFRAAGMLSPLAALAIAGPVNAQQLVPTFSKSFAPDTIAPGGISTLAFDIVNTSSALVTDLAFTDDLPAGVVIATPANAGTDCPRGSVSAPDGGTTIAFSGGGVSGGSSCSVSVDVTASTPGTYTNVSGDLTSSAGNSGNATDDLIVTGTATDRPEFSKSFSPGSVALGGRSRLTLTIDNTNNSATAYNLTVVDNLPEGMVVASPANASTTCTGGVIGASPGGSLLSYGPAFFGSGDASVAAGTSCTVGVDVNGTAVGLLVNTTGELTSTTNPFGGTLLSSGTASATLTVTAGPIALIKSFTDDPVAPGDPVTLLFTVLNRSLSDAANITFTDDLDAVLAGLAATSFVTDCGGTVSGTGLISFSGGSLSARSSCTISATLQVPGGAAPGNYTNTTSAIIADIDGRPVEGNSASDVLSISEAPRLTKTFTDDPVGAGDTVNLEFTITNVSTTSSATDIAFEDVFDVVLPTASSTPADGFCGAGSTATYTPRIDPSGGSSIPAKLVVSGASLDPGASCTFSLDLDVAVGAAAGSYPNTTSEITATVGGETVTGDSASDDLEIVGAPSLIKEFTDDPAQPGGTVTLQFTLEHAGDAPGDATDISFTDDLTATLDGLTAVGLPASDVCGLGSTLSGDTNLALAGGTLAPGEFCTFSVALQVPSDAAAGTHTKTTSAVVATVLGVTTEGEPGTDDVQIAGLTLTKEFTDDPVLPGGIVNLSFTVSNINPGSDATGISFQDDLGSVLSGLNVAATVVLPQTGVCGSGSELSLVGGDTLLLQGGNLLAGTSCTFDVEVQVPAGTPSDTYVNTTNGFVGTIGGSTLAFDNATAPLIVNENFLALTKEFTDDPVVPGGTVTLAFSLTNLDASETASGISFTDDLDFTLPGLTSISAAQNDICGAGSQISGTSLLSLTGGTLIAGETCTFEVTLQVPGGTAPESFWNNTTSAVTGVIGNLAVTGDPATDALEIANRLNLTFTKAFSGAVFPGDTVNLTFNITNAGGTEVVGITFQDNLDAVLSGLVAQGLPAFGVCGTGSELNGTSSLTLLEGNLLSGGSCTFSVVLLVPEEAIPDSYLNTTGDLFVSGISAAAPASDTLVIEQPEDIDTDGDGVLNEDDVCPGTAIPEDVPTKSLGTNRFALVDDDFVFDTTEPNGQGPGAMFTIFDTAGCSCEQIIEEVGLGSGHEKFGCSLGAMENWVNTVNP